MTEHEFDHLRAFLKARSGLALGPEKRYLVESRLAPVCQRHGLQGLAELVSCLRRAGDPALESAVIEAMTTNETFFFRDRAPFELFRDVLLPRCLARRDGSRRIRIWCAAASTGQEPYSLAMLLHEAGPLLSGWSVEILATDISAEVVERARSGLYTQFEVQRGLPVRLLLKYFTQVGKNWQLSPAIRSAVKFRPLNLLRNFAELGAFDVIFCRNVLIYFDTPTKTEVLRRLARSLNPGGAVLLGAAETVIGLSDALVPDPEHRGLYVAASSERARGLRVSAAG
ncbi:MAG: protein-glutamate O-methyltransferase CheR [Microvirga sp.]|jgi:chemotaxis protein methyltransferase CheR|nr:protein-glutamate O-methyltransferase CheR [Microvirga sp.]